MVRFNSLSLLLNSEFRGIITAVITGSGGSMAKSIVIVDDSKFLLKSIKIFMEEELGFDVVGIGHNGVEAIELYQKHKPDVITLDITMPQKDGQQALKELLEIDPNAKVVMMSAIRGRTLNECMDEGAAGFIIKPLKFYDEEFVESTRELFQELLE